MVDYFYFCLFVYLKTNESDVLSAWWVQVFAQEYSGGKDEPYLSSLLAKKTFNIPSFYTHMAAD